MKKLNLLLVTCLTTGLWTTAALADSVRDRETHHKALRGAELHERAHEAAYIGPSHHDRPVSGEHRILKRVDRASSTAAILGGIIGGIAGSRLATLETRGLTTIAGTIVGAAVGYELVRDSRHSYYFHPQPYRHVHRHYYSPRRHARRHVSYRYYGSVHDQHRHGLPGVRPRLPEHHRYYSRAD